MRRSGVVAVTFTDAAANEMRLRIRQALLRDNRIEEALALDRSYILTVHSFGKRLLRENAFAAKLSPSPRLLNDDEKDFLIRMELARELARSSELALIARDLPRFDYRYNPVAQESAEDVFRSTVGTVIDKLRSLGNRSLRLGTRYKCQGVDLRRLRGHRRHQGSSAQTARRGRSAVGKVPQ